jgi:hypothetical protein
VYSTDRASLLVPVWLFEVRGNPAPVTVVAIQQAYPGAPERPCIVAGAAAGSAAGRIVGATVSKDAMANTGVPAQTVSGGSRPALAT